MIGASAGGIAALEELVSQLHSGIDAAYFIVVHLSGIGIGDFLVHRLQQQTKLACLLAGEEIPIEQGKIYIAQPDKHLIVGQEGIKIGFGPAENRWKPSIDVLFRSAAAAFDGRTIGIVLTGYLNDGAAGMIAIRQCGGICIVQDPNEAIYPDMPISVLNYVQVDYCVLLTQMGAVLEEVTRQEREATPIPEEIKAQAAIAEHTATGIENAQALGKPSSMGCPDCGGVLFEVEEGPITSYRCHTGHRYSVQDLLLRQKQQLESTFWVALRFLEERKSLLKMMESKDLERGFQRTAKGYAQRAAELQEHIDRLRSLVISLQQQDVGSSDFSIGRASL